MTEQTAQQTPSIAWHVLQYPLELPCGAISKKKLVKAAISIVGEVRGILCFPEKPGNLDCGPQTGLTSWIFPVKRNA